MGSISETNGTNGTNETSGNSIDQKPSEGKSKSKYVNKTKEACRKQAIRLRIAFKWSARAAGITGAAATAFGVASLTAKGAFIAGVSTLSIATPIGWAALGCVGIALTLLAVRHVSMKKHGLKTDTMDTLAVGGSVATKWYFGVVITAAITAFCIAALSAGESDPLTGFLGARVALDLTENLAIGVVLVNKSNSEATSGKYEVNFEEGFTYKEQKTD